MNDYFGTEAPRPERSTYTPLDFVGWRDTDGLILSPRFQRRSVWTTPARSYLIDTLLRGLPVPPLYLRVKQNDARTQIVREVIDGQQRISAVLDFLDGFYALSPSVGTPYAGKRFKQLPDSAKDRITHYSFICEVFHGISDSHVLDIFARVNTYSVRLNAQELRNGKYFGPFKRTAYALAFEHVEFWRRHRIFTDRHIARMVEVEFTSELVIAMLDGLQDKKGTIDAFYAEYDEEFQASRQCETRFRNVIGMIDDSVGAVLGTSQFRRPPLFYTLFCAVYHRVYGLPGQRLPRRGKPLTTSEKESLQQAVQHLSDVIVQVKVGHDTPRKYSTFVNACLRQTDNIQPRQRRLSTLYQEAFA